MMMFKVVSFVALPMRLIAKHLWPDISCTNSVDPGRNLWLNQGKLMKTNNRGLKKIAGAAIVAASAAMGTMGATEAKAAMITVSATGNPIAYPYNNQGSTPTLTASFSDGLVDTDNSSNGFYTDPAGQIVVNGLPGGPQTWIGVNIYMLDGTSQDQIIVQSSAPGNPYADVQFLGPISWFSGDSLQNVAAIGDILSLTSGAGWGNDNFAGQIDGFGYVSSLKESSLVSTPEPGSAATLLTLAAASVVGMKRRRGMDISR